MKHAQAKEEIILPGPHESTLFSPSNFLPTIMSSGRPSQLQLPSHAENGTSFKRSFEQYGFDLDTPVSSGEASGSGSSGSGNERNKRARSEATLSDSDEVQTSPGSSEVGTAGSSGATSMELEDDSMSGMFVTNPISLADDSLNASPPIPSEPLALATHEFLNVQMSIDDELRPPSPVPGPSTSTSDHSSFRVSLERFSVFDSEISALRRPHSRLSISSPTAPSMFSSTVGYTEEHTDVPGLRTFSMGPLQTMDASVRGAFSLLKC